MLQTLLNDPKKCAASALLMLSAGLVVLSCGILWQSTLAPVLHLHGVDGDFIHGFSIGLGLTLEICAVVILVRIGYRRPKS